MTPLSYSAPGMLFPAISLLMLAYTNRFLGLASLIRSLVARSRDGSNSLIQNQVRNLRLRIALLRHTQAMGVISLFFCTASILSILIEEPLAASLAFGLALAFMMASLVLSLIEIHLSVHAINIELDGVKGSHEPDNSRASSPSTF